LALIESEKQAYAKAEVEKFAESLMQFISKRMYEIEASGASEYLTGLIVAYGEMRQKLLSESGASQK
jgi:hypothetical protein